MCTLILCLIAKIAFTQLTDLLKNHVYSPQEFRSGINYNDSAEVYTTLVQAKRLCSCKWPLSLLWEKVVAKHVKFSNIISLATLDLACHMHQYLCTYMGIKQTMHAYGVKELH